MNRIGIAITTRYAPLVNLVIEHDDEHQAGERRAEAVDDPRPAHPAARLAGSTLGRISRFQCRTMPVWPSVNDMNTPRM